MFLPVRVRVTLSGVRALGMMACVARRGPAAGIVRHPFRAAPACRAVRDHAEQPLLVDLQCIGEEPERIRAGRRLAADILADVAFAEFDT